MVADVSAPPLRRRHVARRRPAHRRARRWIARGRARVALGLDEDPSHLTRWVGAQRANKLGFYFGALVEYAARFCPSVGARAVTTRRRDRRRTRHREDGRARSSSSSPIFEPSLARRGLAPTPANRCIRRCTRRRRGDALGVQRQVLHRRRRRRVPRAGGTPRRLWAWRVRHPEKSPFEDVFNGDDILSIEDRVVLSVAGNPRAGTAATSARSCTRTCASG